MLFKGLKKAIKKTGEARNDALKELATKAVQLSDEIKENARKDESKK